MNIFLPTLLSNQLGNSPFSKYGHPNFLWFRKNSVCKSRSQFVTECLWIPERREGAKCLNRELDFTERLFSPGQRVNVRKRLGNCPGKWCQKSYPECIKILQVYVENVKKYRNLLSCLVDMKKNEKMMQTKALSQRTLKINIQ